MTVDQLKSYFGKNKNIAKFYGVTPEAISMWRKRKGQLIPKTRAIEAEYRTNGALKYNQYTKELISWLFSYLVK